MTKKYNKFAASKTNPVDYFFNIAFPCILRLSAYIFLRFSRFVI